MPQPHLATTTVTWPPCQQSQYEKHDRSHALRQSKPTEKSEGQAPKKAETSQTPPASTVKPTEDSKGQVPKSAETLQTLSLP